MEPKKTVNKKVIGITAAIAAAVCAAVLAVIFALGGSADKRLAEQLDLANRYLEELDYEQAVAAFEAAIEIDPKNEDAYLGLAEAYIGLEDYESAAEAIEEGIEQTGAEALEARLEEIFAEQAERQEAAQAVGDGESGQEAAQDTGGGGAEVGQETAQDTGDGEAEQDTEDEETETETEQETAQDTEDGETEADTEQAAEDGETETETASPSGIGEVTAGQIITFGSYEQDGNTANGKEPIKWYVLEASGGEAVLLSVYLLDRQPYHEDFEDITWEDCTLRNWLNSEFYNAAFSAEEQQAIINANVVNEDNPFWGTEGGNDTVDKVWLLSIGEVERYSPVNESNRWWLRSPGFDGYSASCVNYDGGVDFDGHDVDVSYGVRPALKVAY